MKKILITVAILATVVLLSSCMPPIPELPDEAHEIRPFCQQLYLDQFPEYPMAFVGACTAYFQSGKADAFKSLCGYEPFWEQLSTPEFPIDSKQACIDYLTNYEE